jgi:Protein of unknown function (DUF4236)
MLTSAMGFRFQRRIRILPGIRLNISWSGASTSLGVRGAHVTFGRGRRRVTMGLPGTGISYSKVGKMNRTAPGPSALTAISSLVVMIFVAITLWHMLHG